MKTILAAALALTTLTSAQAAPPFPKEGTWRGVFTLAGGQESPFNFEVKGRDAASARVYLLNGSERFELSGLRQRGDSLFIPIDVYDAVLAAKFDGQTLTGAFKRSATDAGIPFRAEWGKCYRFAEKPAPASVSLQGKWDVLIGEGPNKTVGVFEQRGNALTGSILTTTGDYRYLEGSVQGDEFSLSTFHGSAPLLIKGRVSGNELTGDFIGFRGTQAVKGTRNAQAALPDAYTLTKVKDGQQLAFTFPDLNGKSVSLSDPKYRGKVVIVTILGSWCPNCVDETAFLAPWYRENKGRGVEIIGLAYERKNDLAFAKSRLDVLKKRFDVEYDILFAGPADKKFAAQSLPALSDVLSFPTTIYIDKSGNVAKIHTGYTGPATGAYYEEFVKEFNRDVSELLAEKTATATPSTGK